MRQAEHRTRENSESLAAPVTESLEVIKAFGDAWSDHDLEAAMSFLTEDCLFDGTGPAPDGRAHLGHDAIREAWRPIFDDALSRFETEETLCAGEHVVQLWRYSWDGGHVRGIDVFKIRGDKISEKRSYVKG